MDQENNLNMPISRREFIGTSLAVGVTAVGVQGLGAANWEGLRGQDRRGLDPDLRLRLNWNEEWKFKRQLSPGSGTEPEFVGAEKSGYDDSSWARIWLPHTWDATPDNPFVTSGHFHGVGWYRKWFEAPKA